MGLTLVTAPVVEPIGLQQAKDHLRVEHADDDALIDLLIAAARRRAEDLTARQLITAIYDQTWHDGFPSTIRLLKSPVQSVASVKYIDGDGVEQTLNASLYTIVNTDDRDEACIVPAYNESWPATRNIPNAVTVRFTAGFGDGPADIPAPIHAAMLLMIGHLYERREETHIGPNIMALPTMAALDLLKPHTVPRF